MFDEANLVAHQHYLQGILQNKMMPVHMAHMKGSGLKSFFSKAFQGFKKFANKALPHVIKVAKKAKEYAEENPELVMSLADKLSKKVIGKEIFNTSAQQQEALEDAAAAEAEQDDEEVRQTKPQKGSGMMVSKSMKLVKSKMKKPPKF